MKFSIGLMIVLLLTCQAAFSATIAIVDSGVDVLHQDLEENIWINPTEIAGNNRDEDRNGYQDDIYGWNFAERNNRVIERKYIGTFSNRPYRFFEVQGRMFLGKATAEDKIWYESLRGDKEFAKEMGIFGNFVHGTHVAGITLKDNPEGRALAVKLIPTEAGGKSAAIASLITKSIDEDKNITEAMKPGLRYKLIKASLKLLGKEQVKMMEEISAYIANHGADIANGSFGTGYNQAKTLVAVLFKPVMGRLPTDEEADDLARAFLDAAIETGKMMMAASPKTLWVFAAGNDGMNNDIYPTSPTNIQADNKISVAATYKYNFIAPFSNYGIKMVDVAAPGMLIRSQIPGSEYLEVSGTSQAAPFVANIAAKIKDANPALRPKDIKKILMGTVDGKSFLTDKVKSAGIVNMDRAVTAAKATLYSNIDEAIATSKSIVADVEVSNVKSLVFPFAITPIPLAPMFK